MLGFLKICGDFLASAGVAGQYRVSAGISPADFYMKLKLVTKWHRVPPQKNNKIRRRWEYYKMTKTCPAGLIIILTHTSSKIKKGQRVGQDNRT
jgi:hypothetical protein